MKKIIHYKFQNWMRALILIFVLSVIGLGISVFVGIFIPFWILLVFSLIYSIEKWFSYITRKYKYVGKLYRLILNLVILSLLGLLVWSGIKLFSQELVQSSLIGSIIFIAEFVFFIWLWRVVSKNSWRWPSMKLTIFSLICLFIIFAFAGVKPMSSIKDDAFEKWDTYRAEQIIKAEEKAAQAEIDKALAEEEARRQAEIEQEERAIIEAENKAKEEQAEIEREIAKQTEISEMEHEVVLIVNLIRADRGISMLMWDETLYEHSKTHSTAMAEVGDMFHTDMYQSYAENCWMGGGSSWEAIDIVDSWMDSPKHRTWLLCPNLKNVAVGIVCSNNAMFASWTFWRNEPSYADWWYQDTPDNPPEWWY